LRRGGAAGFVAPRSAPSPWPSPSRGRGNLARYISSNMLPRRASSSAPPRSQSPCNLFLKQALRLNIPQMARILRVWLFTQSRSQAERIAVLWVGWLRSSSERSLTLALSLPREREPRALHFLQYAPLSRLVIRTAALAIPFQSILKQALRLNIHNGPHFARLAIHPITFVSRANRGFVGRHASLCDFGWVSLLVRVRILGSAMSPRLPGTGYYSSIRIPVFKAVPRSRGAQGIEYAYEYSYWEKSA
jgi:hypothetical protein